MTKARDYRKGVPPVLRRGRPYAAYQDYLARRRSRRIYTNVWKKIVRNRLQELETAEESKAFRQFMLNLNHRAVEGAEELVSRVMVSICCPHTNAAVEKRQPQAARLTPVTEFIYGRERRCDMHSLEVLVARNYRRAVDRTVDVEQCLKDTAPTRNRSHKTDSTVAEERVYKVGRVGLVTRAGKLLRIRIPAAQKISNKRRK